MKKIIAALCALLAVVGCDSSESSTLPEKAELLASNTIVAKYRDTVEQPCRFMTALCPDKCDHATRLARFEVLANENYQHPGKYGDEKLEPGELALVDVKKEIPGQSHRVAEFIDDLLPGDTVRLTICHYYVQQGQGHFPVRPVVRIERVKAQ